jgi:general secretion pathway protein G
MTRLTRLPRLLGNSRGFTLIEIMLVVIIIGVLVAMVAPRLAGRSQEAKEAAARADINSHLSAALDMFELHNGRYPSSQEGLAALRTAPPGATEWKGPYLKRSVPMDPWGKPYIYRSPGQHNRDDYDLFSAGPDGAEGTADDVTNWK